MEPKLRRTAQVDVDEKMTPDTLQRALDLMWTQDVPGDARLGVTAWTDRFTLAASWDVLDLPAEPDDTETEDADAADLPVDMLQAPPPPPPVWEPEPEVERIPLENVKVMASTEDSVTFVATLPERFQPAFKSMGRPLAISIGQDLEPDREAIAARLKQQWTGLTPGL